MEKTIEQAVGRVIETMRENIGEPLTIDDMARTVMFSKFHFSRFFQRVTGVSPGRFLSAMRLQEAKRLLISTSLTVTDVSHRVGYTSVGTFSSRFTRSVGVSPTTYRQLGGFTPPLTTAESRSSAEPRGATVRGEIRSGQADHLGLIFVGLFADAVPHSQPVRTTVLQRPGPYQLTSVPHGSWHLIAHSVAAGLEEALIGGDQTLCIGSAGPIRIRPDTAVHTADVRLDPVDSLDSPIVHALLDVRSVALTVGSA